MRQGTIAKTTHDPNIAYNVTRTAQASVNHVNNVATGRSPNAYAPYDINDNATSYYNSSRQTGKTPSPDAPRVEDVVAEAIEYCKGFAEKALIVSTELYLDYKSFENGMTAAIIRNIGQPGTNIFGALEQFFTGKTTVANQMHVSLNSKIHYYEQSSYNNSLFYAGMVTGDVAGSAADIAILIYTGGASAGVTATKMGGNALVIAAGGSRALTVTGTLVLADGTKNGFSLGKDLNDLISAIKENGDSSSHKNGIYEKADYHSGQTTGNKNPAPKDGQFALDNSVPIGSNTTRRIGLDSNGNFVVFDETSSGVFHGHVRTWNSANGNQGLAQAMKNALYKAGYIKSPTGTSYKLTDYALELLGQ